MTELQQFKRILDGGLFVYNVAVDLDNVGIPLFLDNDTDSERELDCKLCKNIDPLSPAHLACHLPKCAGFRGCDMANTPKSQSRRLKQAKVTITVPDAITRPFGAMIHMDHI